MANKIIEKIVEPAKIYEGSALMLKVKAIRYITYNEMKEKTYNESKAYTYAQLKGD